MRVFGPDVVRGCDPLTILCLAMLVASACGLVEVVLLMVGRSWLSTANVLPALVVNMVLNLILGPKFGMNGAAVAWMAAIFVTNLVPLWQTSRGRASPGRRALGDGHLDRGRDDLSTAGRVCVVRHRSHHVRHRILDRVGGVLPGAVLGVPKGAARSVRE